MQVKVFEASGAKIHSLTQIKILDLPVPPIVNDILNIFMEEVNEEHFYRVLAVVFNGKLSERNVIVERISSLTPH